MLAWMPAAHAKAAGQLDEALNRYADLLTEAEEGRLRVWGDALPLVWAEASTAFAAVADWEGFEAFIARLKVCPSLNLLIAIICHLLYDKSLSGKQDWMLDCILTGTAGKDDGQRSLCPLPGSSILGTSTYCELPSLTDELRQARCGYGLGPVGPLQVGR